MSTSPWAAASAMLSNAKFIKQELANVYLGDAERAKVLHLCENWESIYFDLIDDELSLGLAESWVREGLAEAHAVVQMLDAAAKQESRYGPAYLLVCESAVNVLNSYCPREAA